VPNRLRRLGNNSFVVGAGAMLHDGERDRFQQILIADRSGQKLDRAGLHGPSRCRYIGR
jgi:hypothetical protein